MSLEKCVEKMRSGKERETEIKAFEHLFEAFASKNGAGRIREEDVRPLENVPTMHDVVKECANPEDLSHTAFIKLNGGLGTSMGLRAPKSSLAVAKKDGKELSFLDVIIHQVETARKMHGIKLPLIFFNSLRTTKLTLDELEKMGFKNKEGIPLEIVQNREPKLTEGGLPVSWPEDPSLEWCPMGHGDIFNVLYTSKLLDVLADHGILYLFISNSDNLGARPSTKIASYFAASPAPFMMEVARRTPSDIKGGQILRDKSGKLILREMSQVSPEDMKYACDISRHAYFNTNNLWIKVKDLKRKLEEVEGNLDLPLIVNRKTVDPANLSSTEIIQLETAMGSAIGQFEGAACLEVDRPRFLPVKTTEDLFIMRSDRFHLTDLYEMEDGDYHLPNVVLDRRYYKNVKDFDARIPSMPSLAAAKSVKVEGDWKFGKNVSFFGDAVLKDEGKQNFVPDGSFVGERGIETTH